MGIWSKMVARTRRLFRALVQSEEHLGSIASTAEQLRAQAAGTNHSAEMAPYTEQLNRLVAAVERGERQLEQVVGLMARQHMLGIMADPRFDDPLRLERSGFGVHAQYDEDGIIAEIFRRIGSTSRIFVEFGSGKGNENCTGFLLLQGWRGLWIEGDPALRANIERMWADEVRSGQLAVRSQMVTPDSIDGIIASAGLAGEIDLLVVDVDGQDYHVLQGITSVSPRVICAECNGNFGPEAEWTLKRDDSYRWDGVDYRTGASLKAMETMLSARGYSLVGCSIAGVNAFFVRNDLTQDKFAAPFTAENHYHPFRYFYAGRVRKDLWRGWRV